MDSIYLFGLASRHNQWLAVRQATIAGNIANANTPGFKALDTQPFEDVLQSTALAMRATRPTHLAPTQRNVSVTEVGADQGWETSHSGNTISLDQELLKAGEVNRSFALNANILKAFHRMLLMSVKG
ncbi:MAG TPA: flagellar basal body rod protein FlgB [Hyphomicrobiaceae bacterium]|nr:flagellar basal body rod protein FlgB [Hyphomicrobiaceae bacterium]